jgi:shikimate dehydrogenase
MRVGVTGWPVRHSRSPALQNAALRAAGLTGWRYQLLPIPPSVFEETIVALPAVGFRGVNVTIPHKERALALVRARGGAISARARAIGAVNTVLFEPDGGLAADNTDAPAVREALGRPATGLTALVLGAGGSARAAIWALLDAGAAEVRVWNRTPERARSLCAELGGGTPVSEPTDADVLVNCTSVGLHALAGDAEELAQLPLDTARLPYSVVLDLVYRPGGTALVRRARELGRVAVDGLEVLVGQGAISFEQFTRAPAPVSAMREALGLPR